jgi:hypothetical protein
MGVVAMASAYQESGIQRAGAGIHSAGAAIHSAGAGKQNAVTLDHVRGIQKAETLEGMIRAFEPGPVSVDDLGEFYVDTIAVRMNDERHNPMDDLLEDCGISNNAHLFMGHRGSGKSTELNKLITKMRERGQPVHSFDCLLEMDMFNPLIGTSCC